MGDACVLIQFELGHVGPELLLGGDGVQVVVGYDGLPCRRRLEERLRRRGRGGGSQRVGELYAVWVRVDGLEDGLVVAAPGRASSNTRWSCSPPWRIFWFARAMRPG